MVSTDSALQIHKVQDGGYIVLDAYRPGSGDWVGQRFASSTIDEALAYIKAKLEGAIETKQ
jgi:hypothetical protein